MTETSDRISDLHTSVVDAKNGYEQALKDSTRESLVGLFEDMHQTHAAHADQLGAELIASGVKPDNDGSFMSTVHRRVMDFRSLFNGLDESVLPGLIDGEKRLLGSYDEAIKSSPVGTEVHTALVNQRQALHQKIESMQSRNDMAA
jgi:uncharacterized protein (TIGR02284 family)